MFGKKRKLYRQKLTARDSKVLKRYRGFLKEVRKKNQGTVPCPFCTRADEVIVEEAGTMMVVRNEFPYGVHGGGRVIEHFMLLPKRHLKNFDEFSLEEVRDYWQVYVHYASNGYSTTTWALGHGRRSVPGHVHTHLVLSGD